MEKSYEFLSLVLDSITEHIVVIDKTGAIQFVNKSWSVFGSKNACIIGGGWSGVNYIDECDKAASMGDEFGAKAGSGIRSVIEQRESIFYFEYPCHSPDEERWFMMRMTPFQLASESYYVISHQNITERKLAEDKDKNSARLDGLTNIPNRRTFDEFLQKEWNRCLRLKKPICLAMIDIDHFKLINDEYGHQAGDDALIQVGELLQEFANRPGDICARYGGEEFAIVWGDTSLIQAEQLANEILNKVIKLNIPNCKSPTKKTLTISIGLSITVPQKKNDESELICKADTLLYKAKNKGRNRLEN
jgi:diguanylate cyclase (GGDEF)-like protein